jgi:hypothetical protein
LKTGDSSARHKIQHREKHAHTHTRTHTNKPGKKNGGKKKTQNTKEGSRELAHDETETTTIIHWNFKRGQTKTQKKSCFTHLMRSWLKKE